MVSDPLTEFETSGQKSNKQKREISYLCLHTKCLPDSAMAVVQENRTLGFSEEYGDDWN